MRPNLAARAGRWSAAHWKIATLGWIAFVAAAVVLGGAIGTKQVEEDDSPGESGRMARILDESFPQRAEESVLVQSETLTVDDRTFASAVEDVVRGVSATGVVVDIRSPLDPANADQVSADGRSALVTFAIRGDPDDAGGNIEPVIAAVDEAQAARPDLFIGGIGDATIDREVEDAVSNDLERAGLLSLPITLAVLIVAFGALVAAAIPLLLALSAVVATMGLLALPSQFWPVDESVGAVVLLIGLAVGVDYSLFYLKREREERAAGRSERAALEAAAETSGRAVLVSGLTVVTAMAGMFLTGDKTFSSFAVGTITVVAIAVLGSLTVLPALLSRLGDRVNAVRVPLLHRLQRPPKVSARSESALADSDPAQRQTGRFWGWIAERVLRRPVLAAALSAGALIALALPALGMKTVVPGAEALPQDLDAIQVYKRVQAAFPGEQLPALVVVRARSVDEPQVAAAIDELRRQAVASGAAHEPITSELSEDRTVARIELPIAGTGSDAASYEALATLRDDIVPATLGAIEGVEAGVTGETASSKDFDDAVRGTAPLVFAFVLVLAFLLLLVAFRSLVIAIKAIVLNLLSVAAAYGVMVLVFQHGIGKDLLGFEYTEGVMVWLPVFLFVILFGLSMDYHVFILSRVREAYDRGMRTEDAIGYGIKTTAGVVSSAAIVMVFVFSIFATLSLIMMKQFGVGLATAVLIDATIVRGVLLPATMKLLGEWNWYLPRWLRWLPTLKLERGAPARPAPEVR
jgi:RND superfamily putative drug exporter